MAPGARGEIEPRRLHPALVFALLFAGLFSLLFPLLRLPYFWDETQWTRRNEIALSAFLHSPLTIAQRF